ncbi:MAG: DNA polymerase Y family protein [Pseudomonadota bacterium]
MSGINEPFALLVSERGTRRLHALNDAARRLGLFVGQKATDAAALVPELFTADADPEADAAALEALVDWCVRFSPAVAADAPDGLFLDVTGVSHLWGGEAEMAGDLLARLAAAGIAARAAVADTPGAAWALARFGESGAPAPASPRKGEGLIAPPGSQRDLLAPLPVAALRLDADAAAQLPRLGLIRVERLLGLPRGQLTRRFGPLVQRRLDQALGRAEEALRYRRPPTPWFDRLALAEPISVLDDLVRAAGDIADRLCARLEREGRGARRFELTFHRLDGKALPVRAGLSRLGREPRALVRLIAPKLEAIDPGFGIEVVTLSAAGVETVSPAQGRLDAGRAEAAEEGLAALVDRLANRLGEANVWRDALSESHVPERAVRRAAAGGPATGGWPEDRPRPVRLFARPEPVTAMAVLPDEPPRTFVWRGRQHRIRLAEGPERIAEEWWRKPIDEVGPAFVRDYYRVEDEAGGRWWLFRAGLYGDPEAPPRWWLHGVFA